MKIIKPGKYGHLLRPRVFHCGKCGLEFEADFTEYHLLQCFGDIVAECKCPGCGRDALVEVSIRWRSDGHENLPLHSVLRSWPGGVLSGYRPLGFPTGFPI